MIDFAMDKLLYLATRFMFFWTLSANPIELMMAYSHASFAAARSQLRVYFGSFVDWVGASLPQTS